MSRACKTARLLWSRPARWPLLLLTGASCCARPGSACWPAGGTATPSVTQQHSKPKQSVPIPWFSAGAWLARTNFPASTGVVASRHPLWPLAILGRLPACIHSLVIAIPCLCPVCIFRPVFLSCPTPVLICCEHAGATALACSVRLLPVSCCLCLVPPTCMGPSGSTLGWPLCRLLSSAVFAALMSVSLVCTRSSLPCMQVCKCAP